MWYRNSIGQRKDKIVKSLVRLGLITLDQNGLLIVQSDSAIMYLRSRFYYSKPWLVLNCYVHRDLFPEGNWKKAYQFITSNHQNSHIMEQTFTNEEVREYLNKHYSQTYHKNDMDHWYNFRNREVIGLPIQSVKDRFSEQEVINLFGEKMEHPGWVEIIRFKTFTNQQIS